MSSTTLTCGNMCSSATERNSLLARKSRLVYQVQDQWRTWIRTYEPGPYSFSIANGYQVTDTQNTHWRTLKNSWVARAAHLDVGTNFYTYRPFGHHEKKFSGLVNSGNYFFEGDLVAAHIPSNVPKSTGLSPGERAELVRRGATAIKRCSPLNPVVDGATALGEFRKDGLAKLPGLELLRSKGKHLTQKAGSEYLNVEFAVKPLISDLKGLYKAAGQSEKLISQLHRDSGKLIKRSYVFPTESTTTTTIKTGNLGVPVPALVSWWYRPGSWTRTETTVVTKDYKFTGAFTYHLPTDESAMSKMKVMAMEANRLYGARISAETLYNLTPWSWALDWFSNTGDILHNVSSACLDGLVIAYGYIQCHTTSVTTVTCEGPGFFASMPRKYVTTYGFESKARVKASPFGFGLDPAAFTERQWAIVGALGMTKAPKILP